MITGDTAVFGILGRPVAHSLSPAMHNAAFQAQGLKAVYVPFAVADLSQAVQGLRGLNIRGVSVTIPFKEEIIPLLDEVDPRAQAIAAVNTVVNRDGRLWGTNTDWEGAQAALQDQIALAGQRVLVLGAGGAGRAIVYALRQAGAQVVIADVDEARAQTLAREFAATSVPLSEAGQSPAAVLVNASPVGMTPGHSDIPLPPARLANFQVVMDIVYQPLRTRLLQEATAQGCRCINGLQMLVYQGVRQFELFTGQAAPVDLMRQAALAGIAEKEQTASWSIING